MEQDPESNQNFPKAEIDDDKPARLWGWLLPLAFVAHFLDEALLNGGFVCGVQQHIWPEYEWIKFGTVNTVFFLLMILSSSLYYLKPSKWLVLPLFWLWERTWNGMWHVGWALIWHEYSPGLVTSVIFALMLLWFLRHEQRSRISGSRLHIAASALALLFEILLVSSLFIIR